MSCAEQHVYIQYVPSPYNPDIFSSLKEQINHCKTKCINLWGPKKRTGERADTMNTQ